MKDPSKEISLYGQEKAEDIVRLCKMNLAIHGLTGDIRHMMGMFDYVMTNQPFNVNTK